MDKPYKILELEERFGILLSESSHTFIKNSYRLNENKEIVNLNLNSNQISDISFLENLTSLVSLSLNYNQISDISFLRKLTSLTILNLNYNQISDISFLENLTSLTSLSLNNNQISDIYFIDNLTSLTNLSLNFNQISDIFFLENLNGLKSLSLNNNQISDISFLKNFSTLTNLDLNNNQVFDISFLESLESLTSLDLGNNKISDIFFLKNLTTVTSLILKNNQISDIFFLENLTALTNLDLSNNQITDILFLGNLTALTSLDISYNEISNALFLENLTILTNLHLNKNQISDISFLENLTSLTSLDLSSNQITNFSILKKLHNLKNLYLSNYKIIDYSFLYELTTINSLFLGSNDISDISFLKNLKNLKFLYLNYNKISDISIIKELTTITNLYLKNNKIIDISILENLKSISTLDLSNNEIIDIEKFEFIINTPKLNIKASDNPCFENYSLEKDNNNYDTILNILKKLNETKQEYILPAKVLLLGNTGSGKSTLLDYLLQDKEPRIFNKKLESTHIVQIETFPKRIKKNQIPQAVFYDFGGQDYYHGLYKAFLSSNSLNILLWNIEYDKNQTRKDRNNLLTRDYNRNYWLHQLKFQYTYTKINSNNKSVSEPILLVQTQADKEKHFRNVYKGDSTFFNIKNEFYITLNHEANQNSKSLEISLRYFEETLKEEIKLKQVVKNEPIWFKDFLNYILRANKNTFTPLSELVNEYKRDSDPSNFLLPEVLREIAETGLILYYKDDDDLKDVVWLNSSKAIQNIHKSILSRKNIIQKKGIINKDDFDKLVDQKLTKLLLNQKVIFFDVFDSKYIIPGYLPLTEEDDKIYELLTFDFIEPNFILKFEYFIPLGLINQLICFYGKNKNKKYYWRDQLLFTEDNSKILIKLDFTNLEIIVSIKSNENNKKLDNLEQKIFKDILDLYWDKKNLEHTIETDFKNDNTLIEELNIENLIDGKLKVNIYHESLEEPFNSPEDLYISIDNKHFVHHKTLENKELTINKIISFGIDSKKEIQNEKEIETRVINKTKINEHASGIYRNFTHNINTKNMKKIFISYAKENKKEVNEFQKQIAPFKLTKEVETWHCSELELGEDWDLKIKNKFYEADIILYFISTNFFSTPYILDEEVKRGIERDKDPNDNVVLIPIILEKIHWQDLLGKYTSNFKGKPINCYVETNDAWYEVVDNLKTQHFRKTDPDSTSSILGQTKERMQAQEEILAKKQ